MRLLSFRSAVHTVCSLSLLCTLAACGSSGRHAPDGGGAEVPGDGTASPLDRTVTSDFASGFGFIYDGPNATQIGVEKGAIDPRRMAVVRGRVFDVAAQPVAGVRVAVAHEPKLGSTLTKPDGSFDLVVNGGGSLHLQFAASGFLPVDRELAPAWNSFEHVRDVFLTRLDEKVTVVSLGDGQGLQVATGSTVDDRSGQRTGTLIFGTGTEAMMVLPGGKQQALSDAHVRVTEYTRGDNGPKAMPATLPPQSGYTYAVELSIDEAIAAGASEVKFSKPVPYYVENFLRFPVGETVPSGYLDRATGNWVASRNGRVIKVVAVVAGSAQLDTNGDSQIDSAEQLAALKIDAEELTTLGARYAAGSELWRIPLEHFSAWDFNWCFFGKLFDALSDVFDATPVADSCIAQGSVIECENQTLGESIPLVGTPYGLHYRSDRVPGRRDAYHFELELTGSVAPPEAKRVRFELNILGQRVTHVADATPNQKYAFDWDGRDAYGRVWQGPALVRYRVGYVYDGWYSHTPAFGAYGEVDSTRWNPAPDNQQARPAGISAEDDLARRETTMWLPWQSSTLGTFDASALGFGGLTLGVHHTYDAASHTLYLGTGERRQASSDTQAVRALLGAVGGAAKAGQARGTAIDAPHGIAVAADGTVYVSLEKQHKVVRVRSDGTTQVVAGTGKAGASGDGGPATEATLNQPLGLALASDGTLYIAERVNRAVRRVRPDGIIEPFAGKGKAATDDGAPKPALEALFGEPHALALARDGSLYIVDAMRNNVRRVRTDGVIETVLGSAAGTRGGTGDGGPGPQALLDNPLSIALGADGSLYIAEFEGHRIRRMTPDGSVMTVAGTGVRGYAGDDGPAVAATLNEPHTVDVAPDGTLYITDEGNKVLRSVTPDGVMHTVAGGGQTKAIDFTPAQDAKFELPRLTVVEPSGDLIVADYDGDFVYRISPAFPSASPGGSVIASEDAATYYSFDRTGRHLQTVDALTKKTIWSFAYDGAGRLSGVTDESGRMASVQRDAQGRATALVSADGLQTRLSYGDKGWLSTVENPAGETQQLALSDTGLLLSETDAVGRVHSFAYDESGRLLRDTEPGGAFQTLERSPDHRTITKKNALGHAVTYLREQVGGVSKRTVTLADGRTEVRSKQRTSTTTVAPDGSASTTELAADPRFGMQSGYARSVKLVLPSGLVSEVVRKRELELDNPDDPSSLRRWSESLTLAGSTPSSTAYDAAERTLTTTGLGDTSRALFDEAGRVTEYTPPGALAPVALGYDDKGRVIKVSQAGRVSTRSYDARGFLASATDAAGTTYEFVSDAVGRTLSVTAAKGELAAFTYAPGGDLTSVTTATRAVHGFAYDGAGRVSSYSAPGVAASEPVSIAYSYAADDTLQSVTQTSGSKLETLRDERGRTTGLAMPEGNVSYGYDAKSGAIASATLGAESLSFKWDGPLLTSVTAAGTAQGTASITFDKALRVATHSVLGNTLTYAYEPSGRLVSAGSETLAHRDAQRISQRTQGSVDSAYGFSPEFGELLTQRVQAAGATVYEARFERDALGRIVQQTETVQGEPKTTRYAYDALGRLASVEVDGSPQRFAYDTHGNRLDPDAVYDARDRQTRRAGVSYEYTVDGYLARRSDASGARTYTYDARGQLRGVALPGKAIGYIIDALGRRIGKTIDGTLTQAFLYDPQGRLVAELDGKGTLVSRFVYGASAHVPDYIVRGASTLQVVADPRGSPRLLVDTATGQVAQRIDYDAWGNVLRDSTPGLSPFGFAGGLYDPDTQLVRFGARDYDAESGRWTARDPILFEGGTTNLYEYVGSDPVNVIDPTGLRIDTWIRIAKNVWKNHIVPRHVRQLAKNAHKGKFNTTSPAKVEKMANKAICSADRVTKQADGRLLYERDMGKAVGTKGETFIRVVVDEAKKIITTFPADGFKALVPIFDVTGDGAFDDMDIFELFNPGFIPVTSNDGVI